MKLKLLILLFISISCNKNENDLLGSWKLKDVVDQSRQNASDKLTFLKNKIVTAELFANKKLVDKVNGKYNYEKQKGILTLDFGKNAIVIYKIQKLNNNELELLDIKSKKVIRNIRY